MIFSFPLLRRQQIILAFASSFDHIITLGKDSSDIKTADYQSHEILPMIAQRYIDKLYRFVRFGFRLSPAATDDVIQEIFIKLHKSIDQYDTSKALEPWLFAVARTCVLDWLKKDTRTDSIDERLESDHIIEQLISQENLSDHYHEVYRSALLTNILGKLPQRERELIILFFLESKSYEEISLILNLNITSMGTLLSRAKKQLKHLITSDVLLVQAIIDDM